MDAFEITKDAFKYPIKDYTKFIKLALPNIIFAVLLLVLNYISPDVDVSNAFTTLPLIISVILIIAVIIILLYNVGLTINIVRSSINNEEGLPQLNLLRFMLDGLKLIIVLLIYYSIPTIILLILNYLFNFEPGLLLISMIIEYIIIFIMSLLSPAISGKLAETNSISEALNIHEIWTITSKIGFLKVFTTNLLVGIIGSVLSILVLVLSNIPLIALVLIFILYSYYYMFYSRTDALLYMDKDKNHRINTMMQQNHQQNYSQELDQQDSTEGLNFQRANKEIHESPENTDIYKYCNECGAQNNYDSTYCIICGGKL